ncbi:hypothetical protein BDF21DRAFT_454103 [Thamnidium elegans]|nr:hypothetical protein BDF21DRAFT_454103 [Thamnidium elegans]
MYQLPTTYCIRKDLKHVPSGILNVPASQWSSPSKVVGAIDTEIILTRPFDDVYSLLIDTFDKLSKSSESKSIKTFANNCKQYASNSTFKENCKRTFEVKKAQFADMDIERKIVILARKVLSSAIEITDKSLEEVPRRTCLVINDIK